MSGPFTLGEPGDPDHAVAVVAAALSKSRQIEIDAFSQDAANVVSALSPDGARLIFNAATQLWRDQMAQAGDVSVANAPEMVRLSVLASHARNALKKTAKQSL